MCLRIVFFGDTLFGIPSVSWIWMLRVSPNLGSFQPVFLQIFSSPALPDLPWDLLSVNVGSSAVVLQVSESLFVFLVCFLSGVWVGYLLLFCLQIHGFFSLSYSFYFWTHAVSFQVLVTVFFSYEFQLVLFISSIPLVRFSFLLLFFYIGFEYWLPIVAFL